jgi:hypothetical protein
MQMTHYMQLLADNQPWNLILFMAIPVILAETIAVTELYILFTRNFNGLAKKLNMVSSIIVGTYFIGVFIYLFANAVIPLTQSGGWRGIADVIAVGFYLLGVVPLAGLTLIELGVLKKGAAPEEKLRLHATFVAIFLVVAHIAMIFGMLNPTKLGWTPIETTNMPMMTETVSK